MIHSEVTLKKVVIHELVKDQHKDIRDSIIVEKVLDPSMDAVLKLVGGVASIYGKRNNNALYGVFRSDGKSGFFPNKFNDYSSNSNPSEQDFLAITKVAMDELYGRAKAEAAASGGYILFADYMHASLRFLLIAMIKQTDGLRLSKDLVPEELTRLEMKRLHQAARINFSKFIEYNNSEDRKKAELTFLSFVSPSVNKETAGYFVEALGCKPGTASAKATRAVISQVPAFFRSRDALRKNERAVRNEIFSLLARKVETAQLVKLTEIEAIARKFIPTEFAAEADTLVEDLIAHLNGEEHAVPVEFAVNPAIVKKSKRIEGASGNWSISFERTALGIHDDAEVQYCKDTNKIILNTTLLPFARL